MNILTDIHREIRSMRSGERPALRWRPGGAHSRRGATSAEPNAVRLA